MKENKLLPFSLAGFLLLLATGASAVETGQRANPLVPAVTTGIPANAPTNEAPPAPTATTGITPTNSTIPGVPLKDAGKVSVSTRTHTGESDPAVKSNTGGLFNPIKNRQMNTPVAFSPVDIQSSSRRNEKYLARAREFYAVGKLNDAEELTDLLLQQDPTDRAARDFKARIAKARERISYAKLNMANEYYWSASNHYRQGQLIESLFDVKRALELNPNLNEAKTLYQDISRIDQKIIDRINENDRETFTKAMVSFKEGDFSKAIRVFRKLQGKVPEVDYYMPFALAHMMDDDNRMRSDSYYVEAINDIRAGRYKNAQDELYMALEMDRNNFDARLLLEQVDLNLTGN
jgi:tetratricopeptide (TPR) repeat protein